MELPLVFGNYAIWKEAPFMQGVSKEEYATLARKMKEEIIEFVNN